MVDVIHCGTIDQAIFIWLNSNNSKIKVFFPISMHINLLSSQCKKNSEIKESNYTENDMANAGM